MLLELFTETDVTEKKSFSSSKEDRQSRAEELWVSGNLYL